MNTKRKLPSAKVRHLNTYDTLHDVVSQKPVFNQEDWVAAANDGTLDLYIDNLFKSDKIKDVEAYKDKYNLDFADSKTRRFALHNEVNGDTQNVDTKRKKTVIDINGNEIEEEYMASDYEYNLNLIRQQTDYLQQMHQREIAQDIKDSMSAGEHIMSFISGMGTSLTSGLLSGVDNLIALAGAAGEVITAQKGTRTDTFVESLASDKYRPFADVVQEIVNFEANYTSMRDLDGGYTTYGKYVGGVMTSIGEMLPSMLIGKGVGKAFSAAGASAKVAGTAGSVAAQGTFYAGMSAGNVQDTFLQYQQNGADIDSAMILANSAIKSTLQWAVEYGLGKILGTTSLDNMVFGRAQTGVTAKTLTKAGLWNLLKDAGQEGLEEVLQDTSDFFVDEGFEFFVKGYKNYGGISWQSLVDAFVIGSISSFVGSARNIITSQRIVGPDGKKLNKIASWQYGLDMSSLAESLDVIDKNAAHFRTYNRQNTQLLKANLSDKERNNIKLATVEAYAAYRMITSIYNEIGEERFKAANDVLEKMTTQIKSGVFTAKDAISYADGIRDQLKGLSESGIKKIAKELRDGAVTKTEKIINKKDVKSKDPTSEKADTLAKMLDVDSVTITDGSINKTVDKTHVIDKETFDKSSVGDILKTQAIADLVNSVVDNFGHGPVFDRFVDAYKQYASDESPSKDLVVRALLFDKDFFTATLLTENKDAYKLLSYFSKLVGDVKYTTVKGQVERKQINDILNNWYNALSEFCIIHREADPSMFLQYVIDYKKRKQLNDRIKRERWGGDVTSKILNDPDSLSADDKKSLINRVKYAYSADEADTIINDLFSGDFKSRARVLGNLLRKYHGIFNNLYDGKTYAPDYSIPNRIFNKFLQTKNLTIANFLLQESLTDSELLYIENEYKKINDKTILAFRQFQFSQANKHYNFDLAENGIMVYSDKYYSGYIKENDMLQTVTAFEDSSDLKLADRFVPTDVVKRSTYITSLVTDDLNDITKNSLTLDDIIMEPTLLKKSVQKDAIEFIKSRYNRTITELDSESTYLYLSYMFINAYKNKSIVLMSDGNYGLANMEHMLNVLNDGDFELNENTSINDIFKSKYIPSGLKLKITDHGSAHFSGYKTIDGIVSIDNTIYIPRQLTNDKNYLRWVLAHEFHHAMQFEKNMNIGFGPWKNYMDANVLNQIVSDVRRHMPQIFGGIPVNSTHAIDVVERFVYYGSGESWAYGLGKTPILDYYPVLIHNTPNDQTVVLPWGTEFKINRKQAKIRKDSITANIQNMQEDSEFKTLTRYRSQMNIAALSDKRAARDKYGSNLNTIYSSPAVMNYVDNFSKLSVQALKDIKTTLLGNPRIGDLMKENLYVNLNFNHKYDVFLETDLPFVTLEYSDTNSNILRSAFVDTDAINLSQQILMYIGDRNINLNSLKIFKGSIKPKDIIGYLNVDGYKQIFIDNAVKLNELGNSSVDSHIADFNEIKVTHKGKSFWIAAVDKNTGDIVNTWTYQEAEALDFDLNSFEDITKEYLYFTTELLQDDNTIKYDDYGSPIPNELVDKINAQIIVTDAKTMGSDFNARYKSLLKTMGIPADKSLDDIIEDADPVMRGFIFMGLDLNIRDYRKKLIKQYRADGKSKYESSKLADAKTASLYEEAKAIADYVNDTYYVSSFIASKIAKYESEKESNLSTITQNEVAGYRPPKDDEIAEDDPRAKNFVKSPSRINHKYVVRYLKIDEKGNQLLTKTGKPIYSRVRPSEQRKVTKKKWTGTKLEAFAGQQLESDFQKFILKAENLDPVLQEKIDGAAAGTLTRREVMDYFRSKKDIPVATFKAINNAFFHNEYIDTPEELDNLIFHGPEAWALWRVAKLLPSMQEYKEELENSEMSISLFQDIVTKDSTLVKDKGEEKTPYDLYGEFLREYSTTRSGKDIKIPEQYYRYRMMKVYDGSIKSQRDAVAVARLAGILPWKSTERTNEYDTLLTEAYVDVAEELDMDREDMIDALKERYLATRAKALEESVKDQSEYATIKYQLLRELKEYADSLNDMTDKELSQLFGGHIKRDAAIIEGLVVSATGKYININKNNMPKPSSYKNKIDSAMNFMRKHLDGEQRKKIIAKYPELFNSDFTVKSELYQTKVHNKTKPGVHVELKSLDELSDLFDKINTVKEEVKLYYKNAVRDLRIEKARHQETKRQLKRLEKAVKKDGKTPHVVEIITDDSVEHLAVEKEIPLQLMKMLQVHYNKTAKTAVQNLSSENERHIKMVANSFYEHSDELLLNLTQTDVDAIIDFFVNGIVNYNDATAPYQTAEIFIMTYFVQVGRTGGITKSGSTEISPVNFVISNDQLMKLENLLEKRVSRAAKSLTTWRTALRKLNPVTTIHASIARRAGVTLTDEERLQLLTAAGTGDVKKMEDAKAKVYDMMRRRFVKQNADRNKLDRFMDAILQYERLAMLSGPGTWVRNWTSNMIIEGINATTDKAIPGLDKVLMKLFKKSYEVKGQYKIAGTKITNEVADYIKVNLKDNKLLDMAFDGVSKYDVRKFRIANNSVNALTDLLASSVTSLANTRQLFANKQLHKVEELLRKALSDDPWVKRATVTYLGKMITEDVASGKIKKDKILSSDKISEQFLNYVAEAYKLAAYDYMHKPNVLFAFESDLAKRNFKAYFMYKQIFPFAGAGWNWFVEGLNYTPIGLAKSIVNFAKLENTIEKMDNARMQYKYGDIGVSSDFAAYITKRNITKGLIGSIGFIAGALLAGFGRARLDEEDDKYKLVIGDVHVDVSDLFGTQGIFFGISLFSSIKNRDSVDKVLIAGLDQLFIDSTFSDVFNTFRYSQSPGDWLMYQTYALPNMMIPNLLKTASSIVNPYKVKFSDGIKGKIEKLATNAIPFLAYGMPHYYDPYTGEKQIPYKLWFVDGLLDRLTPLGIRAYNVSDLEKLCIEFGVNKSQLTGKYTINDEEIKLNSSQVEKLNQFYGQLNTSSFKELKSGKITYKIQEPNGKYKKVTWNSATDKEKAAIVSRIMTNNSGHAKIYALTSSGKYKYYASDSEYKELKKLGIIKNVYKSAGKNNGFVKIN